MPHQPSLDSSMVHADSDVLCPLLPRPSFSWVRMSLKLGPHPGLTVVSCKMSFGDGQESK